jgi:hypothetical protein
VAPSAGDPGFPLAPLLARLDKIEAAQQQAALHLATLATQAEEMNGTLADLSAEVGSAPHWEARGNRRSLRERMHDLESSNAPVVFEAAVERVLERRKAALWSAWQKYAAILGALAAGATGVARLFGVQV